MASQEKGESVRPGSSREAKDASNPDSNASFDSVLLGPDLRPSRATSATSSPRRSNTAAGTGPATPKSVVPAQRPAQQQPAPQAAQPSQPAQPVAAQPQPQATMQHPPAASVAPLQLDTSDNIPSLQDLPANLSARTLIASLDPQEQQTARDKVQIAAREVDVQLSDPRLVMHHEPDSERAATFRILRHRLVERGHPRTIVVTSPRPRDGKTLLAINLSLALSECGRARVLLVEANLRQPNIAAALGFRPPQCFSAQLASHKTKPMEPWMVAQVASPWLHVIAIDPTTFDTPRVIDGPAIEAGLDQLKRVQYDYVVIDTPPVLGSADVNLIQDAADGVLMAAWARRTSAKDLARAIDQLTPAKILGTVLLDV